MSSKLTLKQTAFIDHYLGECKGNGAEAASKAGYKGNKNTLRAIASQNLIKVNVKARINQIRANIAMEAGFTREKQLKDLEYFKNAAKADKQHTAGIAAVKEQNEMLGFHRELAPNAEKEAAKLCLTQEEQQYLDEYARKRTADKAQEPSGGKTVKIGA